MDRIAATNELAFRVGFSGHGGHLRIEPLPPVERPIPLNSLPDFIPNELSVQFDESFKKAWEEDVAEFLRDGLYNLYFYTLVPEFKVIVSCVKSSNEFRPTLL
ncbi:DExH-box ATP-dependent RNA helicase DExH11-like [Actinidia eriantha]|uniref:DExH-box ATP-dependent RNA helicase DExH11-like n=1 Tax=Actinidia eriantha TaxID=165200 RepID=UPI0025882DD3|nr:DExH-box ATP-dependent RNA helicase DExH11-like [Actinidia eriantha]